MNDSEFDAAWRAFARDDAGVKAPARVRLAVMAAWDAARHGAVAARPGRRQRVLALVAVATVAALFAIGLALRDTDRRADDASSQTVRPVGPTSAIFMLAADPTFDTESLQIVRVRVPRTTLQAFGVPLLDPEASSLLEVDVLVGDDGLPREIRQIRPAVDSGAPQRVGSGQ